MTTAMAPPAAASFTLVVNAHVPRMTSAIFPARLPAGAGLHNNFVESMPDTLASVAGPMAVWRTGDDPGLALMASETGEDTCSLPSIANTCELVLAPTLIASGETAGAHIELSPNETHSLGAPFGPQFPAQTATGTPAATALWIGV